MVVTTESMIEAGALRQLCVYHAKHRQSDASWAMTIDYAHREFRNVSPEILDSLICHCMDAETKIMSLLAGSMVAPDFIPD